MVELWPLSNCLKLNFRVTADASGSKHFHLLLLGCEISEKATISREFKEEIVQPILKVKRNFDLKNLKGLFYGGDGLCYVGQLTDGKLKHFSNVHFSYPNFAWS